MDELSALFFEDPGEDGIQLVADDDISSHSDQHREYFQEEQGADGALHALRCICWCLRGTQSARIDQTVVSHHVRCVFAYCLFRAPLQRRENRSKFLVGL